MDKKIITRFFVACILFSSCHSKWGSYRNNSQSITHDANDIVFIEIKNFFIKNTATKLFNPRIETQSEFDKIYGAATTMGNYGKPTFIDFSKQVVISVILNETDLETIIVPIALKKENNNLLLTYKKSLGKKQTYTSRPNFAILIDKSIKGRIILKELR